MSDLRDLLRSLSPEEKRALRRGLREVEKQLLKGTEKPRTSEQPVNRIVLTHALSEVNVNQ